MRISPICNSFSNKHQNFNGTFRLTEAGTYTDFSSETFFKIQKYNYYPTEEETQEEINKAVEDKIKSAPRPKYKNHPDAWSFITKYKITVKKPSEINEEIKVKYW